MEQIMEGKKCIKSNIGLYMCEPCSGLNDPSYPTLKIRIGHEYDQHWFEMAAKNYMYQVQVWCVIQFRSTPDEPGVRQRWVLGDVFLRAYDAVHDLTEKRLGLIGKALTLDPADIIGPKELEEKMNGEASPVSTIIIVTLSVMALGMGGFGIYMVKNK